MTLPEHKLTTAKQLAAAHREIDPCVQHIYLLQSPNDANPDEPIKLLEIVEGTIERGIEPIYFGASAQRGVAFASMIVDISPREFADLNNPTSITYESDVWTIGPELAAP